MSISLPWSFANLVYYKLQEVWPVKKSLLQAGNSLFSLILMPYQCYECFWSFIHHFLSNLSQRITAGKSTCRRLYHVFLFIFPQENELDLLESSMEGGISCKYDTHFYIILLCIPTSIYYAYDLTPVHLIISAAYIILHAFLLVVINTKYSIFKCEKVHQVTLLYI